MAVPEYLPKVLISHSWKDKEETMIIADGLRELNCAHVWIDFEQMKAGVDINTELENQIRISDFMVLVWTTNSMGNGNVMQEIEWALKFNIPIIPCYFQFDETGETLLKLLKELKKITGKNPLGVEFRNNNNGIIELYSSLYAKQSQSLPKEIADQFSEKHEILKRMEGYNKYLTNYRNIKDTDSNREPWIERIMREIDSLEKSGLSKETVDNFMYALYKLENSDPEAFRVLKPKLDNYFSPTKAPVKQPPALHQYQTPISINNSLTSPVLEKLKQKFLSMLEKENGSGASLEQLEKDFPQLTKEQKTDCIQSIINLSADGIYLLDQACLQAQQAGLEKEFLPILDYVAGYYFEVEDLRSDNKGALGWVDDTYLCFSALQQINHLYYSVFQRLLLNFDLNPYLQFLLPLLNKQEITKLDAELTGRFSSINWNNLLIRLANFTVGNINFGYQQTAQPASQGSSWGGTWEDEMAERAARLGISWNY